MYKKIVEKNTLLHNEWLMNGQDPELINVDGTLFIQGNGVDAYVIAYRDIEGKLKELTSYARIYNTYKMSVELEVVGDIKVEIGVFKYYTFGYKETQFYTIQDKIQFLSEGIDSLYFIFRLQGSGTLKVQKLLIEAVDVCYRKEESEKGKQVEAFYEQWKKNKTEQESVQVEKALKMATILDEFSFQCWQYEANCQQLSYTKWQEEIEAFKPHLLFVESAWQGKNNSWANRIARWGDYCDEEVIKLVKYCKEKRIPTVFWDKEGFTNFHYFINTASLFDYVGVTDENILEIHQSMRNKGNVFILPFAAQPVLHHSNGRLEKQLGDIAFAGSWYGEKYPSRMREMEIILKPTIPFNLHIYDRNYDKSQEVKDVQWEWPQMYRECIVGKLPYLAMVEAYRQYKVFLSVQSIKESKWMIPRRIYELLASGTPVISSRSEGILHQFKEDIYVSESEVETKKLVQTILEGGGEVEKRRKRAQCKILEEHTYSNRLKVILDKL